MRRIRPGSVINETTRMSERQRGRAEGHVAENASRASKTRVFVLLATGLIARQALFA